MRAVRHHDDHGRLDACVLDDYLPFSQHEIEDADLVGRPWTADQLQFIRHEGPGAAGAWTARVREDDSVVEGGRGAQRPARTDLTWSRELTAAAEEHFRAFAPADVRVDARDFATFLGEVCGAGVERRTLSESRALFAAATARLVRRQAGPWADRDAALHAEVRAMLLGLAVPEDTESIPAGGLVRLSDATYRHRRAGDDGVGRAAASAVLKVAEHVGPDAMVSIFPELAAATVAVGRLRDGELPAGSPISTASSSTRCRT